MYFQCCIFPGLVRSTQNVGYHQEINQPLFSFFFNLIFLPIFEAPLAAPTLRTTQFENRVSSFDWSSRSGSVVEFHVWFHLPPIPRSGCLRKAIKPKMFWITKTSSQDTVTQDRRGQIAHWCKRCKRWGAWPWPCASCLTLRTLWHPVDKYCLLTHWKIHTGRSHPRLTNEWTHTHTHTGSMSVSVMWNCSSQHVPDGSIQKQIFCLPMCLWRIKRTNKIFCENYDF